MPVLDDRREWDLHLPALLSGLGQNQSADSRKVSRLPSRIAEMGLRDGRFGGLVALQSLPGRVAVRVTNGHDLSQTWVIPPRQRQTELSALIASIIF